MKLKVTVDGRDLDMEIRAGGQGAWHFRQDSGAERIADVAVPQPGVYSILLDGRSYDASVERTPSATVVVVNGHRFEITVRDPRRWSPRDAIKGKEGVQTIVAPMPGKVIRLLVSPGDEVEAGKGIVVIEAMKMQNEMKASRKGRVRSIAVVEGATVSAGEVLATLE
jgi:biotin carboxyl carrier protein